MLYWDIDFISRLNYFNYGIFDHFVNASQFYWDYDVFLFPEDLKNKKHWVTIEMKDIKWPAIKKQMVNWYN